MLKSLWKIKSFNFTSWNASGTDMKTAMGQIDAMIEKCSINTIVFTFAAQQEHCFSTFIDWKGPHMFKDGQLSELIAYAKDKGLKVVLKPMLNTRDYYWRAYIRFFDEDVPCEPKWSEWFRNYTDYIVHYAQLCEAEAADMLIAGCELVGTDHRQVEWRELIKQCRQVYSGLVTYNCDKYQEHNVSWWDALDVISSSGYYPINDLDRQLARIAEVVEKSGRPFFFSEVGCPSTKNAALIPNDWNAIGVHPLDLEEQNRFFEMILEKCSKLDWHYGCSIWDWPMNPRPDYSPASDPGYNVIGKPAQNTIRNFFNE